jgi:hypothetical protein
VLIDVNDDAYLIDLSGGYTVGWIEREILTQLMEIFKDYRISSDTFLNDLKLHLTPC